MDERDLGILVKMLLETDEIEKRIEEYEITESSWFSSRALRDLLLMPLLQIGELSAHFKSDEPFHAFPNIPWRDIKGFRSVVVHGYGHIDLNVAWNTVIEGVRELRHGLLANDDVRRAYESELELQLDDDPVDLFDLIRSLPTDSE